MTAFGEYADDNTASTLKQRDYKDATDLVAHKPSWWNGEQTAATLTKQNANGAQRMPDKDNFGAVLEPTKWIPPNGEETIGTLRARDYKGIGNDDLEQGRGLAITQPVAHAFKVRGGSEDNTGEQGGTPGKKAGKGYLGQDEKVFTIGTTQDQQIMQPITFRKSRRAKSKDDHETWVQDNKANTINTFDVGDVRTTQSVVQPLAVDCYNQTVNEKTSQTIGSSASDVNHYGAVLQPVAGFLPTQGSKANGIGYMEEQAPTLRAGCDVYGVLQPNIAPTITQCKGSRGGSSMEALDEVRAIHAQQPTMAIRRLTPTECERLQGFPDDWTLIPYRNKSADQCPDGPRYKACGNSMAVPVMRWIGERIQMVEQLMKEINENK
jgi:site-specific DNA-cytosine methylase